MSETAGGDIATTYSRRSDRQPSEAVRPPNLRRHASGAGVPARSGNGGDEVGGGDAVANFGAGKSITQR